LREAQLFLDRKNSNIMSVANLQKEEAKQKSFGDSVPDRAVPLGFPLAQSRVEAGLTIAQCYKQKHGKGGLGRGTYCLHQTVSPWGRSKYDDDNP
jgi:hypothetical protein